MLVPPSLLFVVCPYYTSLIILLTFIKHQPARNKFRKIPWNLYLEEIKRAKVMNICSNNKRRVPIFHRTPSFIFIQQVLPCFISSLHCHPVHLLPPKPQLSALLKSHSKPISSCCSFYEYLNPMETPCMVSISFANISTKNGSACKMHTSQTAISSESPTG